MIDEQQGVLVPEGGRKKSEVPQVSPLTAKARAVLEEIKSLRKSGAIVSNVAGLVFTRDNGSAITKSMIHHQLKKALKTGVTKFTFHNSRNTALTNWARQGIHVDIAMKAAGHSSIVMHRHYLSLGPGDVAQAFGTAENLKMNLKMKKGGKR